MWSACSTINLALDLGADPLFIDDKNNTILHVLARDGYSDRALFRRLRAAGVDPAAVNAAGQTAADIVALNFADETLRQLLAALTDPLEEEQIE